jgi:hypothetical protein
MKFIHKPVRIEPAFEDREAIRAMFARHAPYRAIAAYIPTAGVDDAAKPEAERVVQPWFRGNWAAGGEPLVEGAEAILHNKQFLTWRRPSSERRACFQNLSWSMSTRPCLPA